MTVVHQVKPEYKKLVAAIPHSVAGEKVARWLDVPSVKAWRDRYVDWFTDELFGIEMYGVSIVKAAYCRLECDVERLEGEKDRLCHYIQVDGEGDSPERRLNTLTIRNECLADWYRYRAEVLAAAAGPDATIIVDCHSFPSDIAPDVDVCIGFNEDASKPKQRTLDGVARVFQDAGYTVAFNHPFANALAPTGFIGHSLMIEVNKRTYMDEKTLQKTEGFGKLKKTIGDVYRELLWVDKHRPMRFTCPIQVGDGPFDRAAWESLKRSIVEFTAKRYGIPMPTDLSDTDEITRLRHSMVCKWGGPSWERARAWMLLGNTMLTTVFDRVGVTLPRDALVPFYGQYRHVMPEDWNELFRDSV